ncbi:MAG: DUF721 domain-containing protein [Alphaproteobacteria bacterium]|nr:MAG: DUF721 domain-containing protein [Alphaproteobacteria bacterium]
MTKAKDKTSALPRSGRTRRLADSLSGLTRGLLARQGFAQTDVVTHWPAIVGPVLARHCLPERLAFARGERRGGTLHVVADSAFALEFQYLIPQVIARINGYYGFEAVSQIKIVQAPVKARRWQPRRKLAPLGPAEEKAVAEIVAETRDPGLRAALAALGRAVYASGRDS